MTVSIQSKLWSVLLILSYSSVYVWRTARLQLALNNREKNVQRWSEKFYDTPVAAASATPRNITNKKITANAKITASAGSHTPKITDDPRRDSNDTIAACLLVMDDNHFLIEWLAYHHFVLPLDHVVIAVDPRSRTRPNEIVQRWKDLGMDIKLWDDRDYMTESEQQEHERNVRMYFGRDILQQPDLVVHRARQRLFYYKCMKTLKDQKRNWVLLTDTDEYLRINYATVAALNLTAPPVDEAGSVMKFLKSELRRPGHNLSTPCIQIPRLRFGAKESTQSEVQRHTPAEFNASNFLTLRWRKHADPQNHHHNKISKAMIDLSRVPSNELRPVMSVHRPIRTLCGQRRLYIQSKDQVFLINHYLGSWEAYTYRNDSRVGKERSEMVRGSKNRSAIEIT